MKTIKANCSLKKMFNLDIAIEEGSTLHEIGHQFWKNDEIKNDIRKPLLIMQH